MVLTRNARASISLWMSICFLPLCFFSSLIGGVIGDHTRIETGALLDEYTTTGIGSHLHATGCTLPRDVPAFHTVNRSGQFEPHDRRATRSTHHQMSEAQEKLYRAVANQNTIQPRFKSAA